MSEAVQISGIKAIMLGVRDIAPAVAFYKDKLGLRVIMQQESLALLQCGNVLLGLSKGHVTMAPHVAGATEIAFSVDDVRGAHKQLAESGVTFINGPRQATPNDWVAHFKDPDGHLLSLFGPEGHD